MEPMTDDKGWPNGNHIFTKQEAYEMGLLTERDFKRLNIKNVWLSAEAVTDLAVIVKALGTSRTPAITDEEAQSWSEWDDKISKMDLDSIRNRMIIEGKTNWSAEEYILQDGFF